MSSRPPAPGSATGSGHSAAAGGGPAHRQWARFLAVNAVGFVLNRGTYFVLITFSALCATQPVFATAAGAVAGMFMNFGLSRAIVFR